MLRSGGHFKGSRNKHRNKGTVKRKFKGNQFTAERNPELPSSSAKKLKTSDELKPPTDTSIKYVILCFNLVFSTLSEFTKCKECNGAISFTQQKDRGLGFKICVECSCGRKFIESSPCIGPNMYEINQRIVFVMRVLGLGYNGVKTFLSLMDISSNFSLNLYYGAISKIHKASKQCFDFITRKAVKEEIELNEKAGNEANNLTVSGDGTWMKRGFTSLIGVFSIIGKYTGKVIDLDVKSSFCTACSKQKSQLSEIEFSMWYEGHKLKCSANHEGSAGKMETDSAVNIFKRSQKLYNVFYGNYIGDGDSKTYTNVIDAKPYGDDFIINKLECVLHVGKRMYRRLVEVKKKFTILEKERKKKEQEEKEKEKEKEAPKKRGRKSKAEIENATFSTAVVPKTAKLTLKLIREMSLFYGLAIQRYPDSIENMKKEILAGYYHRISTDKEPRHEYCNPEWCEFLKSKEKNEAYTHKPALDPSIQNYVLPVFESLSSDELLQRCLGRNTQNCNESYNNLIWKITPKSKFSGKDVVEIASWIAACAFNEGSKTYLAIMDLMGIKIGETATAWSEKIDECRISQANRRCSEESKEGRIQKKKALADRLQLLTENEDLQYSPGMAD